MSDNPRTTLLLAPAIPGVEPAGDAWPRPSLVRLLGLALLPAVAGWIALVDHRIGFRLLMAGLGAAVLSIILGLLVRRLALRPGRVRIAAAGELRFVPPRSLRISAVAVPIAFLLPAAAAFAIAWFGLPSQPSVLRVSRTMPYVLTAVSLGMLGRAAWSLRTPLGLRVSPEGLRGVRGSGSVALRWDELAGATATLGRAPSLVLLTHSGAAVSVDAHHLGSDPAIVAALIERYRGRPALRPELADGLGALRCAGGGAPDPGP